MDQIEHLCPVIAAHYVMTWAPKTTLKTTYNPQQRLTRVEHQTKTIALVSSKAWRIFFHLILMGALQKQVREL